jgi:hypothetical protein
MAQADFRSGLQNDNIVEITVTGRASGRPISLPIWFALDGNKLYLIPVKGSETEWYKNLRKRPFHPDGVSWKDVQRERPLVNASKPGPFLP